MHECINNQEKDALSYAFKDFKIAHMQKPKYSEVLKRLMHARSIKPTELARQSRVEQSTISRLVNGKIQSPAYDKLDRIASFFGVSVDQLLGKEPIPESVISSLMFSNAGEGEDVFAYDKEEIFRGSGNTKDAGESSTSGKVVFSDISDISAFNSDSNPHIDLEVPFYEEVELSAGCGTSTSIEVEHKPITIPRYAIEESHVKPSDVACARVRGDSMYPVISDGSVIGIDTSDTTIVDHEIYAFEMDGMLRIKYLYRLPFNRIRIASQNSALYPDEFITQEELSFLRIIGRVFYWPSVRPRRKF